jgi:streptogramin lyase
MIRSRTSCLVSRYTTPTVAALAALLLIGGCALLGTRTAPGGGEAAVEPQVTGPAVAIIHDDAVDNPTGFIALSLTGSGFGQPKIGSADGTCGAPGEGTYLELSSDVGSLRIASADRQVRLWSDTQVVATVPRTAPMGRARLCTEHGWTAAVAVDSYRYDHFDVPPTAGTNPMPLALAIDAQHRVWINEEFHRELKFFDPETETFGVLDIPKPPDPGPFAVALDGEGATQTSQDGEAITVDPHGRIWFTQGGGEPDVRSTPDHSRVVAYDPQAPEGGRFQVYNVPGDHNGVFGVAWDDSRRLVWFTQATRRNPGPPPRDTILRARLTSFDPQTIPADGHFDFSTTGTCVTASDAEALGTCSNAPWQPCLGTDDCVLAEWICSRHATEAGACYRQYEIPQAAQTFLPGRVAVHPADGSIWYTSYWGGNHLGRLDPDSGVFTLFPLPVPDAQAACDYSACACSSADMPAECRSCCIYLLFGTAPWDLAVTDAGDVVFTEYVGGAIGRFRFSELQNPACTILDARGQNPCIDELGVAPAELRVHSLALDHAQNVWFTQDGPISDASARTSIGYVLPDWSGYVLLPPLSLYPFFNSDGSYCHTDPHAFVGFTGAGIGIDPDTQAIWFADFCRKRLGRLQRVS